MHRLHNTLFEENAPEPVTKMVQKLIEQIEKRFQSYEDNELACQATILDPRYKK